MIKLLDILSEISKDIGEKKDIKQTIQRLHGLPQELKDEAIKYLKPYTVAGKGRVSELELHPDIIKKCKEKGLTPGFSMGVDKNGYYIHTHRARGKSHKTPDKIPVSELKFIESTG